MIPKRCFFTKGVGVHKEKLASFELALRSAGLAYCNLVLVSSIFPPGCKRISKEDGVKLLRPGEIAFCVYDRESTNEPNRLVVASVLFLIGRDGNTNGSHQQPIRLIGALAVVYAKNDFTRAKQFGAIFPGDALAARREDARD